MPWVWEEMRRLPRDQFWNHKLKPESGLEVHREEGEKQEEGTCGQSGPV